MNSIRKISGLPLKSFEGSWKQHDKLCKDTIHISGSPTLVQVTTAAIQTASKNYCFKQDYGQVIQLSTPLEFQQCLGIDKFFAEKHGSQIIAFAATKKLLTEEKLRKGLQDVNVPIQCIVQQHWKNKPSSSHSVCPLVQEEL